MLAAFIAALSGATETLTEKIVLRERGVSDKNFLALSMVFIFSLMSVAYIFLGKVNYGALRPIHLAVFVAILFCGFFYNYLYFYAIYKEKVCEVEPIAMLEPLITVTMAAIIFPSERNLPVVGITMLASIALVLSRIEKHHLKFNKALLAMLGFVILISLESQLAKIILEVVSPVALYCIRAGILSVAFMLVLKPNFKSLKTDQASKIFGIAAITALGITSRFYAISEIGIVKSSLIFLLGPVLILVFSNLLLKEKITLKKAVGDAVIVVCVAFASLMG